MHIAIDARHTFPVTSEEGQHTMALLYRLIQSRPEHHFTIIVLQMGLLPALPNVTEHMVAMGPNRYLTMHRWYGKTLPALLIQISAEVFIGINGATAKVNIPQLIFLSSPDAAEKKLTGSFLLPVYKKYLNRQIAKADTITTFTQLQQAAIAKKLTIETSRIVPLGYAVPPIFKPANWQQKETLLEEHSHSSEYFLYTGTFDESNFLLVLKAFSLFKKRQLSSMKLIAAGHFTQGKNLAEKLTTYKYRSDVELYPQADVQTMALLTSAAYTVIYLDEKGLTAFAAAVALPCEVPVIGLANSATEAIATTAGLYAAPTPESLAEQMKSLYKDENLRQQLMTNAAVQLPLVNGTAATQKLWDCIAAAAINFRLHLPPEKTPET